MTRIVQSKIKTSLLATATVLIMSLPAHAVLSEKTIIGLDVNKNGYIDQGPEFDTLKALAPEMDDFQRNAIKLAELNFPDNVSEVDDFFSFTNLCAVKQDFILRRSATEVTLLSDAATNASGDGALFSLTNDRVAGKRSWEAKGIIVRPITKNKCVNVGTEKNPEGIYLDGRAYAGFLRFDGSGNSVDGDKSNLSLGLMSQYLFQGGPFGSQLVNLDAYVRTDFEGDSRILGANATYRPSLRKDPTGPQLGFSLEADYLTVEEGGASGLTTGEDYLWLGGKFDVTFKSPKAPLNAAFKFGYNAHWDVLSDGRATLGFAELSIPFDKKRRANLVFSYENGTKFKTLQEVDQTGIKLSYKF